LTTKRWLLVTILLVSQLALAAPPTILGHSQSNNTSNTSSATLSYTPTCSTLSQCAIVINLATDGVPTTISCTDGASHPFTAGTTSTNGSARIEQFYLYPEPSGIGSSYSCSWTSSKPSNIALLELSGLATSGGINIPANNTSTGSGSSQSVNPTSSIANDLMIGAFYAVTNSTTFTIASSSCVPNAGNCAIATQLAEVTASGGSLAVATNQSSASAQSMAIATTTGASGTWSSVAIEAVPPASIAAPSQFTLLGVGN